MPLYRDEAIVLRTQKLGEADRIVTLLTRQHGKVRAVAKGVRRTRSPVRRAARAVHGRRRPALRRAATLDTVTQAETLAPYGDVDRPRLRRLHRRRPRCSRRPSGSPRSASRPLQQFLLLVGGLRTLADGEHEPGLVLDAYLLRSLAVAGWAPSFDDCARCGAPGPHRAFAVAGRRRGLPGLPPARLGGARPETLELLAALLAGDWDAGRRRASRSTGARAAAWSPPTCSGTSSAGALAAAGRARECDAGV